MKTFLQRTLSCLIIFVCLLVCVGVKQVVNAEDELSFKIENNSSCYNNGYASSGTTANMSVDSSGLTMNYTYSGVNTQSENGTTYSYKMYVKNNGFIYSTSIVEGYYVSSVEVTFSSTTGTSGKIITTFSDSILSVRDTSGTVTPTKGGTYIMENSDVTKVYWNFSTTGANVQVTDIVAKYMPIPSQDLTNTEKFMSLKTSTSAKFSYDVTKEILTDETVVSIEKATSISIGDQVIFVCETKNVEFTSFTTSGTIYGVSSSYDETPNGTMVFEVVAGSTSGTYAFKNGSNYLYWTSGNSVNKNSSLSAKTSWNVTFADGNAVITNASDSTRKLQYNASNPRFACYTSSQTAIQLYKKVETTGQTVEKDIYNISSSGLRFGTIVEKELYEALLAEGAQFGVAFAKKSELNGTDEFDKDSAVKYNLCSNVVLLEDGENYQFALVINNIPAKAFDEVIVASVYVEIDGVKYVANTQSEYSILTILNYYVDNAEDLELESALMEGLLNAATEQNTLAGE